MARTSLNTKLKSKSSRLIDRLSNLSDDVLCKIVSELPTKDSIRFTSMSKQWRNHWLSVPALDLHHRHFGDEYELFEFIDKFLESNGGRDVKRFKLIYDAIEHDQEEFESRIDDVVKRGVCDLTIINHLSSDEGGFVVMPLSLYSCATLVNLTLNSVVFDDPESESVSLPCLKTMHLEAVRFNGRDEILKPLISSCLVLEELTIITVADLYYDGGAEEEWGIACVCSQSLKSFKLESTTHADIQIDAPRLEYLSIRDYQCESLTIHSIGPYAKVNLDVKLNVELDDPSERSEIGDFLNAISTVREMIISARTLEFIRGYSKFEPLPQFSNVSHLEASFPKTTWEFLPSFLGCCPNLKSLVLEYGSLSETDEMNSFHVPQCFISSLEFVELKTPATLKGTPTKLKLAIYFIRNCAVLKKLVVSGCSDDIIKKIEKIPKRSPGCEVVVVKPKLQRSR
ncbi:unnamed protein product [Microthlaspi erraticum]|uniref:FBD domain-containing protein n=1 Tax=Microthlaspi erraticum TaxID=1685480 RepID=A0A6D2JGF6_9BRAS|nr:unnamed protein product [Microthlaspi erraticum]